MILYYASYQVHLMRERKDYQANLEVYEYEYGPNESFSSSDLGFHIAAGLSDYTAENKDKIIEDPTYGEIVFFRKEWNNTESTRINWSRVAYKQCEKNDFNWGDGRPTD